MREAVARAGFSRSYFKLIKFIQRHTTEEADLTGWRRRQASKRHPEVMSPECTDTVSPGTGSRTHAVMYCHTDRLKDRQTRGVIAEAIRPDAANWAGTVL